MYKKNENIINLADEYDSDTLISAGLMRKFCNENEDNIAICRRAAQIVYNNKNIVDYLKNNTFKSEKSVKECLRDYVGIGNSQICHYISGYLSRKGIEAFVYNDKTTGKLICLILDDMTKTKLSVYFESIDLSDFTKKNSDIADVHFFSYPFMKNLGVSCMTNLEIVDFLYRVTENSNFPKVDYFRVNEDIIIRNDREVVDFFAKKIYEHSPLFCLVGPSGCGKTSIANCLTMKGLTPVESYTTRQPRFKNEPGHIFISEEEFDTLKSDMISTTHFSGYNYGITPQLLNQSDIFVVDPAGVKELKEKYHSRPIVVIAYVCSKETCKKRMLGRGDSFENVNNRLTHDELAFSDFVKFVDVIISAENDFSQVLKETLSVIKKNNF